MRLLVNFKCPQCTTVFNHEYWPVSYPDKVVTYKKCPYCAVELKLTYTLPKAEVVK